MILNCAHYYCRDCGAHHGFEHKPGCPTDAFHKRRQKAWEEYRNELTAIAIETRQDGDVKQAPLVSGAGPKDIAHD